MPFYHGKNTHFSIEDAGNTVRDISSSEREVNFPRQADMAETTAFGSTVKTFVPGIPGATFSVSGMFEPTVDGYLNGIYGLEDARDFIYGPSGSATGRVKYTGQCYLTNYSIQGSTGDMVSANAEFQVTGAITRDVF